MLDEIGVPTVALRSKDVGELADRSFDVVVTVCGEGEPSCPFFPGGRQLHHALDDPSAGAGSQEELLDAFRRTRDEVDSWIQATFAGDLDGMS